MAKIKTINSEARKHDENLDKTRIHLTTFVSFLMGFSQAVLIYVMSTYFKQATGSENVGIFYAVAYIVYLAILLNLHKWVRFSGKANVFYFAILFKIVTIALLVFTEPSATGIFLLMLYIVSGHIEWVALDIIIESFSVDGMSGRIRGLHLTIINAGFLFGPFVATYILENIGFQGIFVFSLIFNAFVLIFALLGFRQINHRFEKKLKVADMLKKVLVRKNIMRIYYISFVLDFFYALMIIYTPIYLLDLGYSWADIGKIFTVMLIPFVLVQYPAGALADKKFGEKEALIFSLFVMGIASAMVFFIGLGTLFVWAAVLLLTRIGAALIEILRDSYFYKRIDGRDVDLIGFFRTTVPVGYIVAAIASSFMLLIVPVKFVFLLIAVAVFSALWPAWQLQDNKCEAELAKKS